MDTILGKIGAFFVGIATLIGGFFSPPPDAQVVALQTRIDTLQEQVEEVREIKLGAVIPVAVAGFSTSLASGIASTDTEMTLVSTSTDDGTDLTNGSLYGFVIDEGTTSEEFVTGIASSSRKITSMSRGVSVITGNTEITDLKKSHRRGASVKITNAPILLVATRILNGDELLPNLITYEATTTACTANDDICDKAYIDGVAVAGASDADETTKGIVEQVTIAELPTATSTGDTTAPLFVPAEYFLSSSTATTTVVVTDTDGNIDQGFLDLTEEFVFTGGVSSTATTSITGDLTTASTSITGNLTYTGTTLTGVFDRDLIAASSTNVSANNTTATTTLISVSVPADTLVGDNAVFIEAEFSAAGQNAATDNMSFKVTYGGSIVASGTVFGNGVPTARGRGNIQARIYAVSSSSVQEATLTTFFYDQGSATSSSMATGLDMAHGSFVGTGAVDATSAQTLTLTIRWNSANASNAITMESYTVYAILKE